MLASSAIFILWGGFSLNIVIQIPKWIEDLGGTTPMLHFGYIMSTIAWVAFSFLFLIFAYGTFRKDNWVWTTGLIITTIFLVVYGLMLVSFMITALLYQDLFSVVGLVTTVISFLIDIGIVFYLTRPATKLYFETGQKGI